MAKQLETIAAGVGGDMVLFSLFSRARDAAGQRCVLLVDELRKKIHLGTVPDPTRPAPTCAVSTRYSTVSLIVFLGQQLVTLLCTYDYMLMFSTDHFTRDDPIPSQSPGRSGSYSGRPLLLFRDRLETRPDDPSLAALSQPVYSPVDSCT